jgi:hypothetical protein
MRLIRTGLPFLRFRSYEIDEGAQIVIEAFGFALLISKRAFRWPV